MENIDLTDERFAAVWCPGDAENARPENDGQKLRGLENAGLENDGQVFSKLWAQLRVYFWCVSGELS